MPPTQELGDLIHSALSKLGITKGRVSRLLGRDCGCEGRQEKLNQLSRWAKRVLSGKTDHAEQYLSQIIGEENAPP